MSYTKKEVVSSKKTEKPSFTSLIEKKREGGEFTDDEIKYLVDSIQDDEIPDDQLAALLMAVYFKGMSAQETAVFSEETMLSGEVMELGKIGQPKINKYATGSIGDKSTLVLGPLAAACGVVMPCFQSLDEEKLLNDLDKLSAIPGFKGLDSIGDVTKQLKAVGCAFAKPSKGIAPVDDRLFLLRKKIAAIPSIPLITSSVLSKKMGEGTEGLVVDIKWGNGAFIKDLEQAKQLARWVTRVARSMNRRSVALVTDLNQPLGNCVGTSLEVREAVELLQGRGPEDMQELILKLGMEIVRLAGVAGSTLSAKQAVQKVLNDGSALEKFKEMVKAQGGDIGYIEHPEKLPKAKYEKKLSAPKRGYVHAIDTAKIARGVQELLMDKNGKIDHAVGISDMKKVGVQLKQGEPLLMVHYNTDDQLERALGYLKDAYRLAPKRPTPPELVVERVA